MNIDYPTPEHLPALRALFRQAFGDTDAFLDAFYSTAFAYDRCLCVMVENRPAAALYWLDCQWEGKPIAYLYAVATAQAFRGQGLCRALMAYAHNHLAGLGYAGAILVPGTEELFQMYGKMGYRVCSQIQEFSCRAGSESVSLRPIDGEEFCRLRRQYLPAGGVVQEDVNIAFLSTMADFYAGEDFLLTVHRQANPLFAPELLGSLDDAPGILATLGKEQGHFRAPGVGRSFAMYHSFAGNSAPSYFAFAFD